jgi:proteasome lid subunit RPN8/RPN11
VTGNRQPLHASLLTLHLNMLRISQSLLEEIYSHGIETYPDECCGLLLGIPEGETRTVRKIFRAENLNKERSRDRYELNQKDFLKADREAGNAGLEIIGIYHSHPDHPSRASETDRQKAHEGYSYLIVAIHQGRFYSKNSWVLDSQEQFQEEEIIIG